MTVTLDEHVLLYASDETSPFHERALEFLAELADGPQLVYLFWPTVMAYVRLATHPSVFAEPLAPDVAIANVERLLALPHVQTTGERERFWQQFRVVADDAEPRGNLVPDAHLAALMMQNGVRTIWTRDRDFRRFRGIDARDPFA